MKKGFTLIELLVVIGIIGLLVAIAVPNFLSARQRASDSKKKSEMQQLKNALRIYYNDYNKYPDSTGTSLGVGKLNYVKGCGVGGAEACPCVYGTTTIDFASGTDCSSVYMKKFPSNLGSNLYYYVQQSGDDFCLRGVLDNKSDPDIAISQARCLTACTFGSNNYCSGADRYCVCAD